MEGPRKGPSIEAYYGNDEEASIFNTLRNELQASLETKGSESKKENKMSWIWLEATLPLGIIAGMLCVMGNAQYYIHKAAHGRPKHIGNDMWDVAMERRDKKLMEQASSASPN